jgi:hypothetical protein
MCVVSCLFCVALCCVCTHSSNVRQPEISSKFFTAAHAVTYDLLGGFAPFVEKQCVQYTATGQVMYDFKNAEIYLLDLFSGKPLIQLEVRLFQYSNTEAGSTYALRQKVKQEPLTKEMMQAVLKELGTTSRARACLELLETCVSFLQATGGAFVQVLDGTFARSLPFPFPSPPLPSALVHSPVIGVCSG